MSGFGPGTNSGSGAGGELTAAEEALVQGLAVLSTTDGNIIVGNGSTWVAESGATARTSLGVGTGDMVQFDSITANNITLSDLTSQIILSTEGSRGHLTSAILSGERTWTLPDKTGTVIVSTDTLASLSATTSLQLKTLISDETGSGALVFATTPTLVTPVLGAATGTSVVLSATGVAGSFTNSTDGASVQVAVFEGDRATMADNDEAYISLKLSNDAPAQKEIARISWVGTDVNVGTSEDGRIDFAVITAGTLADEVQLDGTALSPSANDGSALGTTALGWADLHLASGGNITAAGANAFRTIFLSGAGGAPTTTIGCGGPTKVEAGTNDIDYYALEFDTATEERAFWNVLMPDSWDGSTVTATFYWTNAGGGAAETVRWGIKAVALSNDEAIDQAYGNEVTVDDTWLAQGDVHVTAASAAITIGGTTPAGGDYVVFNVGRKVGNDDMAGDARLLGVKIEYGISSYSD